MRRYLFPIILGLGGIAILLQLGLWQLRRLDWKLAEIAKIETKIASPAVALPPVADLDSLRDNRQPVLMEGRTTGDEVLVLSGKKDVGAGYEVISAFELPDGRRVLLDRGFVPEAGRDAQRLPVTLKVTGNLLWPDETTGSTPAPDIGKRLWFARNVAGMAQFLGTEPVLVVARTAEGQEAAIVPVPVDTVGIPNDHLNYAITWFSLAAVWAGMTVYLLWRIRQRTH